MSGAIGSFLESRLVAALASPRSVDDYLDVLGTTRSAHAVRARVVAAYPETRDATSVLLAPNERWRGHRAGQFVTLSVRTTRGRAARCFSISSPPGDGGLLRLTMKHLPGGVVSGWAASARPGEIVTLGQAQGRFVLPDPIPEKLLFVTGGSGIAPVAAMVRQLVETGHRGPVACLHYARRDVILGREMLELARGRGHVDVAFRLTRGATGATTRLSRAELEALAPWWRDAEAFVCGPPALESAFESLWSAADCVGRLHVERFAARALTEASPGAARAFRVFLAKSHRHIEGEYGVSLLQLAERAGLRPVHGCRQGICHLCTCRKRSGAIMDTQTGRISDAPDEDVRICVGTPCSDVTLEI